MIDLLAKYEYHPSGTCQCDGHFTHKFRTGNYELRWRKKSYKFRIKRDGRYITEWSPVSEAESKLKEIHVKKDQEAITA